MLDLGTTGAPKLKLVTSYEPCAMCYSAIIWSGAHEVICGARGADALVIGFDEALKPKNLVAALEKSGILVVRDTFRAKAIAVFHQGNVLPAIRR
jgi:tRNA(Arg) A34 adenosine deaminase TadA